MKNGERGTENEEQSVRCLPFFILRSPFFIPHSCLPPLYHRVAVRAERHPERQSLSSPRPDSPKAGLTPGEGFAIPLPPFVRISFAWPQGPTHESDGALFPPGACTCRGPGGLPPLWLARPRANAG